MGSKVINSDSIQGRIQILIDKFAGGVNSQFAKAINLTEGSIRAYQKGTQPKADAIEKIVKHYDINPEWLLLGIGDIKKNNDNAPSLIEELVPLVETRPRIPLDASAGFLSEILNGVQENQCEMLPVISRFPRYDFTILVRGNSMEPEFMSGDEIACRLVNERSFIQWGRPHVLDTAQGVVLKRIYERKESILCRSDNKDYEDFEIPKLDIMHIALVVGSLRVY